MCDLGNYDPRGIQKKVRPFYVEIIGGKPDIYVGYCVCGMCYEGIFVFFLNLGFDVSTEPSCCVEVRGIER